VIDTPGRRNYAQLLCATPTERRSPDVPRPRDLPLGYYRGRPGADPREARQEPDILPAPDAVTAQVPLIAAPATPWTRARRVKWSIT